MAAVQFRDYKAAISKARPLIHCITNHITNTDCANMVLAFGGRPIMAEHPAEVAEIVRSAAGLMMNLGNISDSRMAAIAAAGVTAAEQGLFSLLDLVGVGCSGLRYRFAREQLERAMPTVIKGNLSELKMLSGRPAAAVGVDAGSTEQISAGQLQECCGLLAEIARQQHCLVLATGVHDILTDGRVCYVIANGCGEMSRITGTGCMLGAVLTTFAAAAAASPEELPEVLAYGTAAFGICGEQALTGYPLGSGRVRLFDRADRITDQEIRERMRITRR